MNRPAAIPQSVGRPMRLRRLTHISSVHEGLAQGRVLLLASRIEDLD